MSGGIGWVGMRIKVRVRDDRDDSDGCTTLDALLGDAVGLVSIYDRSRDSARGVRHEVPCAKEHLGRSGGGGPSPCDNDGPILEERRSALHRKSKV